MKGGKSPEEMDFHNQLTLETLLNAGGKATAGYLREQTGLEQTSQIHYRVDEWLCPLGFVEPTGETGEYNGQDSKVYRLTEKGEEHALTQNLDLSPELHRGQLEREFEQLMTNLSNTAEHAQAANERAVRAHNRLDEVKSTVDGWDGQMGKLEESVERIDTRLNRLNGAMRDDLNLEQRVDRLEADMVAVQADLEELQEDMQRYKDWVKETQAWAKDVEERLDRLENGSREKGSDESGGWLL